MSTKRLNPCLDCGAIPEMKTVCPGDEPPLAWCECACGRRGESYHSLEEAAQFWNELNSVFQMMLATLEFYATAGQPHIRNGYKNQMPGTIGFVAESYIPWMYDQGAKAREIIEKVKRIRENVRP